ncbi:glycoside hydrolase family 43 protein [Mucilaginibacter sp. HMF5004]|uniref:glycoside hydrolase family 43 protein n=1 Tax=Mucilaginibacter rivuli TaxID=2857527 RepID=UPI001C5CED53|nr:glycoside hydrolase family 43 protein [Mucilaginibacter rivuli]MBW4888504.1 glycoside hydrolase family 43 protein [Mucilaginibacter rivuli]
MKKSPKAYMLTILVAFALQFCFAQNPMVQTNYTADPAPMVYNGKMYLYTSHDEDNSTWFVMNNWKLYTTEDMVNWTDHGAVGGYKLFDWAIGDAWAIQVVQRNGKFYLYAPVKSKDKSRSAIGVAVADSPYGPFYDALNKPLVSVSDGDIDPTVFIDDDGQAYLYWGNPDCYYAKLNENMISINGDAVHVPMVETSFGKRDGNVRRPTRYEEGPWLYKRNSLYYLIWAGGPIPEHIGYSTGKSATGPWQYAGTLMPKEGKSFTNHPGIADYKGKTYFFYHNGALPGGGGFNRSVCVQEASFNNDGTLKQMKMEPGIAKGLQYLNPYQKVEAETIAWSENVKATQNKEVGVFITAMANGAYTKVKDVDFRDGASLFTARVGTTHNTGITMEIHLDSIDGKLLANPKIPLTGGDDRWALVSASVPKIPGVHDLYFVFRGENKPGVILYFDYWSFSK